MRSTRLSPEKWLIAGLDMLATQGPQALAAEPMARALGTTKGSFYWHFKDLPAYHTALMKSWQADALGAVVTLLGENGAPDARLRSFGHKLLSDKIETALRIWGQSDGQVAQILAEVDQERLSFLILLLRQLGLPNPDFARALLAALTGLPQISPDDADTQIATFDTLVDTVLALS